MSITILLCCCYNFQIIKKFPPVEIPFKVSKHHIDSKRLEGMVNTLTQNSSKYPSSYQHIDPVHWPAEREYHLPCCFSFYCSFNWHIISCRNDVLIKIKTFHKESFCSFQWLFLLMALSKI